MHELMWEFIRSIGTQIFFRKWRWRYFVLLPCSLVSVAKPLPEATQARTKFVLHMKCIRKESHVPAADTLHIATQYFPRRVSRYTLWRSTVRRRRETGYQFARKINTPSPHRRVRIAAPYIRDIGTGIRFCKILSSNIRNIARIHPYEWCFFHKHKLQERKQCFISVSLFSKMQRCNKEMISKENFLSRIRLNV